MISYSSNDIRQLRSETKRRMEDIKHALDLFEGDLDKSRAWLLENCKEVTCRCGIKIGDPHP